jgi:ornithine decarboxylase
MSQLRHTHDNKVLELFDHLDAPTRPQTPEEVRLRQLIAQHGSPLLVMDAERLRQQYRQLKAALPGVDLFYAVKALPDADAIRILTGQGAGLDLATAGEVDMARAAGVSPRRTIHTHPIKKDSEIKAALRFGTTTFVVDNWNELKKFRPYRNRVGLLLRVRFQSPDAVVDLSRKFGCDPQEAIELMRRAVREGIRIKGLSFHVGSQSGRSDTHVHAIETAVALINQAHREGLGHLKVLDIGGGFPVDYQHKAIDIDAFCAPIRNALISVPSWVRVIAEPGRYLVAPVVTAVATVVGKAERDGRPWYYLDDGVYGSYSGQMFDHADYPVETFREGNERESVLAGPTCDSIDIVKDAITLPELEIGDLIVGRQMGAYTAATATDFNALPRARMVLINDVAEQPSDLVKLAEA